MELDRKLLVTTCAKIATTISVALALASSGRAQEADDGAAAIDDRSGDLVLRWAFDESPHLPTRDECIRLVIENRSDRPITLPSRTEHKLEFHAESPTGEKRLLTFGPDEGAWSTGIEIPPGLRVLRSVPVPWRDTEESLVGDLSLFASLHIEPGDLVVYLPPPPLGVPPSREPLRVEAGYRLRIVSPPLRVLWERRLRITEPPSFQPWLQWRHALDSLLWGDARRRLSAESRARVAAELERIEQEWTSALGRASPVHDADDLAYSLAATEELDASPDVRRRWLRWIVAEHPGTSGAERAAALLEWMDAPCGPAAYLEFGR